MFIFLFDFPRIMFRVCLEGDIITFFYKVNMTKQFIVQDPYFKKAKDLGYRARSAFKLLEIQEKYDIIQPGMKVLDVACAPGSFIQVISQIVGEEGRVVGVDIQSIRSF